MKIVSAILFSLILGFAMGSTHKTIFVRTSAINTTTKEGMSALLEGDKPAVVCQTVRTTGDLPICECQVHWGL